MRPSRALIEGLVQDREQGRGILGRKQKPVLAVPDQIGRGADRGDDHRHGARQCFDQGEAEALVLGGEDEYIGRLQVFVDPLALTGECDRTSQIPRTDELPNLSLAVIEG